MWQQWHKFLLTVIITSPGLTEAFKPSDYFHELLKPPDFSRHFPFGVPKNIHNAIVEEWLHRYNAMYRLLQQANAHFDWDYNTNITMTNIRNVMQFSMWKDEVLHLWRSQATRFRKSWLRPDIRWQLHAVSSKTFRKLHTSLKQRIMRKQMRLMEIYNTKRVDLSNGASLYGEADIAHLMRHSRDPKLLLKTWKAWHDGIGAQMRNEYLSYLDLQNNLAYSEGYGDMGMMWKHEFDPDVDVEVEMEALWQEIRPLYEQLHAFVRIRLSIHYGFSLVHPQQALPVHLLGNIWGQEWASLMDICTPYPRKHPMDITAVMQRHNKTVIDMLTLAESFYTSLGLEKMTDDFWHKSMFIRPSDGRQVNCHGTSTNFFDGKDYRIRMCSQVNENDLNTIHHEMGHIQYFMSYRNQPMIFQVGGSPALHESVGETILYSFHTPGHLKKIGLQTKGPESTEEDINFLMKMALLKIPLIPYSLVMDKWRWKLLKHEINATNMNNNWWKLLLKYQGVKPPSPRSEQYFDPGGKYHISHNIPYIGYFYSSFLQVQLHKKLCLESSHSKIIPLHRCNIFGSKSAGNWLKKILSFGSSQPWKNIFKRYIAADVSASDLMKYYAPLHKWLIEENQRTRATIGWSTK